MSFVSRLAASSAPRRSSLTSAPTPSLPFTLSLLYRVITLTDTTSYDDHGYVSVGYEYDPGDNGRITWAVNGTPSWQMNAAALEPNEEAMISQRVVSTEPMALTLNLAM